MIAVAVGVVLLAALILAVWVFARPADAGAHAALADLKEEPGEVWTYAPVERGAEDWVGDLHPVALDDDTVLVARSLDEDTYASANIRSEDWYAGYDEHYEAGYEAGREYQDVLDGLTGLARYGPDRPDPADYFLPGESFEDTETFGGWFDGFEDGKSGTRGSRQQQAPDTLPAEAGIAAVDTGNGQERWFVGNGALGAEPLDAIIVVGLSQQGHVVVANESSSTHVVTALDPDTGEVVSSADYDGYLVQQYPRGVDARVSVLISDDGGLTSLRSDDLSGSPLWTAPGETHEAVVEKGYLFLTGLDGTFVLDQETGTEPEWAEPGQFGYSFVGDRIMRTEYTGSEYVYIDMLDDSGKVLWSRDASSVVTLDSSGGTVILETEYYDGEAVYTRLNPRDGEKMWDQPYESAGSTWLVGTVGNAILLADGSRSTLVDLRDGTEAGRLRVTDPRLGASMVYDIDESAGRLRGVDTDGTELWHYRVPDGTTVLTVGENFYALDNARSELSRLG